MDELGKGGGQGRGFWEVCGGERGRMERVGSGVRLLR